MTRFRRPSLPDAAALIVFAGALALYLATASRTLPWGDAPEFLAVAKTLGIAHPPGYPLYTMLSAAAIRIPVGSTVFRLAALSALGGALAAGLATRVTWEVASLAAARSDRPVSRPLLVTGSVLAGVVFALVPEVHAQSTVPEVYALAAALLAGVALLLLRSERRRAASDAGATRATLDRRFVLAAFLFGVGLAHHLTILLALPGLLALSAGGRGRGARSWLAGFGAALVALSCYLYLPLRAAMDPAVLWAPMSDAGSVLRHVAGVEYASRLGATSFLAFLHDASSLLATVTGQIGWPLAAAGLGGLLVLWRLSTRHAAAFLLIAGLTLGHAALYSIPDIEAYLIPVYLVTVVLAGAAVALLPSLLLKRKAQGVAGAVALALFLVGATALTFPARWSTARARGTGADTYLEQMLAGLDERSMVLAANDRTVFPLWYALHVEGRRPDIAVIDVRSKAPHLERWNPDVRFPTESELAAFFGSPDAEACSPQGRTVLPVQRYAPLLVSLNMGSRPVYSDYELARAGFLERAAPAGYLARIAALPGEVEELPDPRALLMDGPWARWLKVPIGGVDPVTVETAAGRLEEAGKLYLVRGRPDAAAAIIEAVAAAVPQMTKAWNDLGVAYVAGGRIEEGIEALHRAAQLDPAEPSTRANLFDAYRRAGMGEEALEHIRAAIRLDPGESGYRTELALYLERRGEVDRAVEVLEEARRADPTDHAAALAKGDLLARQGRYAEALAVYRRAEELDPDSPAVQSGMGRCYWAMRDVERAVSAMKRSVELQPHNPRLRYDLAVMLRAIGEREEALGHLGAAVRVLPGMWRAHVLSSLILSELERHGEAADAIERARRSGAAEAVLVEARLRAAVARGDSATARDLRASAADTASSGRR